MSEVRRLEAAVEQLREFFTAYCQFEAALENLQRGRGAYASALRSEFDRRREELDRKKAEIDVLVRRLAKEEAMRGL